MCNRGKDSVSVLDFKGSFVSWLSMREGGFCRDWIGLSGHSSGSRSGNRGLVKSFSYSPLCKFHLFPSFLYSSLSPCFLSSW